LLQSEPTYRERVPALTTPAEIAALVQYQAVASGALQEARAAAIRMLGERLQLVSMQAATLKEQIEARAQAGFSPVAAKVAAVRGRWDTTGVQSRACPVRQPLIRRSPGVHSRE
jgi:hypothetical protein